MIIFQDVEVKQSFMKNKVQWLSGWFVAINNWVLESINTKRLVWYCIEGVPLHAWNDATFWKIG